MIRPFGRALEESFMAAKKKTARTAKATRKAPSKAKSKAKGLAHKASARKTSARKAAGAAKRATAKKKTARKARPATTIEKVEATVVELALAVVPKARKAVSRVANSISGKKKK
jgi:DNA-binding protein HU-beta